MQKSYKTAGAVFAVAAMISGNLQAADSASTDIKLKGHAKPGCLMPGPTVGSANNAAFANNTLTFENLLDEASSTVKASSVALTFPGVMCNYNATVSLSTTNGGMTSTSGTTDISGNFLQRVDYVVRASWGGLNLPELKTVSMSAGGHVSREAGGANRADLVVNILTEDGSTPVIEGQFEDTLVVKIGAAY